MRGILNALIAANISTDPGDPERVNVLLQFREWDLAAAPISLSLGGGAGREIPAGADVSYGFVTDPPPVFVPAAKREVDGLGQGD